LGQKGVGCRNGGGIPNPPLPQTNKTTHGDHTQGKVCLILLGGESQSTSVSLNVPTKKFRIRGKTEILLLRTKKKEIICVKRRGWGRSSTAEGMEGNYMPGIGGPPKSRVTIWQKELAKSGEVTTRERKENTLRKTWKGSKSHH